MPAPNRRMY